MRFATPPRRFRSLAVAILGLLGIFVGMVAWAVSSPVGTSPDDNYHLGSIWCPRPIGESGCEYRMENGSFSEVAVPDIVARAPDCLAFMPQIDASCQEGLSEDLDTFTKVFDDGGYPFGYYQFHHLFVGDDVERSVVIMRLVNIVIGVAGLAAVALLASPRVRHSAVIAAVAAWTPMGIYFIASNNPTSWALSGNMIYASALLGIAESTSAVRRRALYFMAAYGAILSATSRSDSLFYLFVITLGIWCLVPVKRATIRPFLFSAAIAAIALLLMTTTGQSQGLTSSGSWPASDLPRWKIFINHMVSLPDYLASMWGLGMGPGWADVPLEGWSTLAMLVVVGGVLFIGSQEMFPRKALSGLVVAGALCGIPVVGMTLRRVGELTMYQGRYMLPLVAVFLLIWLSRKSGAIFFSERLPLLILSVIAGAANILALRRLIGRYAVGVPADTGLLIHDPQWWPWSVSPNTVWLVGGLAMFAGITLALLTTRSIHADTFEGRAPRAIDHPGDSTPDFPERDIVLIEGDQPGGSRSRVREPHDR